MSSRKFARTVLPVVLAVVERIEDGRTLVARLGHIARVELCGESADILHLVEEYRPSLLLIALSGDGWYARLLSALQQVRTSWPAVWIVTCAPLSRAAADAITRVSACGAHELVLRDWGSLSATVARLLDMTPDDLRAAGVLQCLRGWFPDDLLPVADYCLRHAREGLRVPQLAAELEMSRRTLAFRLRRAGLPPPEGLISWCRLFMAAVQIEQDGESIEQVALRMGFASGAALQMMLSRRMHCTWAELRVRGGVAHLMLQFAIRFGQVKYGERRSPFSVGQEDVRKDDGASEGDAPPPSIPRVMP